MSKLPPWKQRFALELIAKDLGDNEIYKMPYAENGKAIDRRTIKGLREKLPRMSRQELVTLGSSENLLKYFDRLRATSIIPAKRTASTSLYKRLRSSLRLGLYPAAVVVGTLAAVEGPRRTAETFDEWYPRIRLSLRKPGEINPPWDGADLDKYIRTIRVAETEDDFANQFIELLGEHPHPDDITVFNWLADRV